MAATLLASSPGLVTSVTEADVLPVRVRLTGWDGFDALACILTAVGLHQAANVQFLHTLRNFIYVYSFGDRIGDMIFSGLAFNRSCDDESGDSGVERLLDYYDNYRVTTREIGLSVAIGRRPALVGFLTDMSVSLDEAAMLLARFTLTVKIIPPDATAAPGPATIPPVTDSTPADDPFAGEDDFGPGSP